MATKKGGKKGKGLRFSKNTTKYLMYVVIASFVLSALFSDYGRQTQTPTQDAEGSEANWTVVDYDSSQLFDIAGVVRVLNITGDLKLVLKDPGSVRKSDVDRLFSSKIEGVESISLERSPSYEMFNIRTNSPNASKNIRNTIRFPGDYILYNVYESMTDGGAVGLIGDGLSSGDYVLAIPFQRNRGGKAEFLAFMQRKVTVGPVLNATIKGIVSYAVGGYSKNNISEGVLEDAFNASEIMISDDGGLWSIRFEFPATSDIEKINSGLDVLGVENISFGVFGFSSTAPEMVVGGELVRIPSNNMVQTTFELGSDVNDTIMARVIVLNVSGQGVAYAIEEGSDTVPA